MSGRGGKYFGIKREDLISRVQIVKIQKIVKISHFIKLQESRIHLRLQHRVLAALRKMSPSYGAP